MRASYLRIVREIEPSSWVGLADQPPAGSAFLKWLDQHIIVVRMAAKEGDIVSMDELLEILESPCVAPRKVISPEVQGATCEIVASKVRAALPLAYDGGISDMMTSFVERMENLAVEWRKSFVRPMLPGKQYANYWPVEVIRRLQSSGFEDVTPLPVSVDEAELFSLEFGKRVRYEGNNVWITVYLPRQDGPISPDDMAYTVNIQAERDDNNMQSVGTYMTEEELFLQLANMGVLAGPSLQNVRNAIYSQRMINALQEAGFGDIGSSTNNTEPLQFGKDLSDGRRVVVMVEPHARGARGNRTQFHVRVDRRTVTHYDEENNVFRELVDLGAMPIVTALRYRVNADPEEVISPYALADLTTEELAQYLVQARPDYSDAGFSQLVGVMINHDKAKSLEYILTYPPTSRGRESAEGYINNESWFLQWVQDAIRANAKECLKVLLPLLIKYVNDEDMSRELPEVDVMHTTFLYAAKWHFYESLVIIQDFYRETYEEGVWPMIEEDVLYEALMSKIIFDPGVQRSKENIVDRLLNTHGGFIPIAPMTQRQAEKFFAEAHKEKKTRGMDYTTITQFNYLAERVSISYPKAAAKKWKSIYHK